VERAGGIARLRLGRVPITSPESLAALAMELMSDVGEQHRCRQDEPEDGQADLCRGRNERPAVGPVVAGARTTLGAWRSPFGPVTSKSRQPITLIGMWRWAPCSAFNGWITLISWSLRVSAGAGV